MNKTSLLFLLVPFVLLTGCNERMKEIKQIEEQGKTDRYNAQLANWLHAEKLRLDNRRVIEEGKRRAELRKQRQFHDFMETFGLLVLIVGGGYGTVMFFRYVKHAADLEAGNREERLATMREKEETARLKFETVYQLALAPEFFAQLSDEHRAQVMEKLEGPPPETPQPEPRQPLHERMYDDAKGAWTNWREKRAA